MKYFDMNFHIPSILQSRHHKRLRIPHLCWLQAIALTVLFNITYSTPTDSTLTVTASPAIINYVFRGETYTVIFDPYAGASTIAPNYNGESISGDLGVNITGDVSTNISVEMQLPDHLTTNHGMSMAITFPSSGPGGGVRAETGGFFNPNVSNVFNLSDGGSCGLRLGFRFTVPPETNISGDVFTALIICNVSYLSPNSKTILRQETVVIPLSINANDLTIKYNTSNSYVKNLAQGSIYAVQYNAHSNQSYITPNNNGEIVASNFGFDISGAPNSNVVVVIKLPKYLSSARGNLLGITFPASGPGGGVRAETGGFFNPNVINTFHMTGAGTVNLRLGYRISVPPTVPDGIYTASMKYYAYYTGLSKNSPKIILAQTTTQLVVEITSKSFESVICLSNDLQLSNLQRGNEYLVSPTPGGNGYQIFPSQQQESIDSSLGFTFTGTAGSSVPVSFTFPEYLSYTYGNQITLKPTSLAYVSTEGNADSRFDPNFTNFISIGNSGSTRIRLGFLLDVPPNIVPGIYTGYVLCHSIPQSGSETEVTYYAQIRVAVGQSFPQEPLPEQQFELKENYPNPFNPGTDISFRLFSPQEIHLGIFNYLGQEIETLFSGYYPAGEYLKHWDATNYPTGIYFYTLRTGNSAETKKLLLIR